MSMGAEGVFRVPCVNAVSGSGCVLSVCEE